MRVNIIDNCFTVCDRVHLMCTIYVVTVTMVTLVLALHPGETQAWN